MLVPRVVHYSLPLSREKGERKEENGPLFPSPLPFTLSSSLHLHRLRSPFLPRSHIARVPLPVLSIKELNLLSPLLCIRSQCLYLLINFYFVIVIIVIIIIRWLLWASKFDDVLSTDIAFRILRLTNTHTLSLSFALYINFFHDSWSIKICACISVF